MGMPIDLRHYRAKRRAVQPNEDSERIWRGVLLVLAGMVVGMIVMGVVR